MAASAAVLDETHGIQQRAQKAAGQETGSQAGADPRAGAQAAGEEGAKDAVMRIGG
jgi:hypothetical protein